MGDETLSDQPDRRANDDRIAEIQHTCHAVQDAQGKMASDIHKLFAELRVHDVRLALVEQAQKNEKERTDRFEVAMGEAHEKIHREIADLRDESRKTIGAFRTDFNAHTKSESDDRRAIIGWLAGLVVVLALHGFGAFQWALERVLE